MVGLKSSENSPCWFIEEVHDRPWRNPTVGAERVAGIVVVFGNHELTFVS
jgi:hypothetical protein